MKMAITAVLLAASIIGPESLRRIVARTRSLATAPRVRIALLHRRVTQIDHPCADPASDYHSYGLLVDSFESVIANASKKAS